MEALPPPILITKNLFLSGWLLFKLWLSDKGPCSWGCYSKWKRHSGKETCVKALRLASILFLQDEEFWHTLFNALLKSSKWMLRRVSLTGLEQWVFFFKKHILRFISGKSYYLGIIGYVHQHPQHPQNKLLGRFNFTIHFFFFLNLTILWILTGCFYGWFADLQFPIISLSIIFIKNSIS